MVQAGSVTEWADRVTALARVSNAVAGIRIIGIDGPSGSGKSTLARAVAAQLDCPVVEIDDFVSWNDHPPRGGRAAVLGGVGGGTARATARQGAAPR